MSASARCSNPSCTNPGTHRCSKCKCVKFCGRDCQVQCWPGHKALCKSLAAHPDATCLLLDGMGPIGPGQFYAEGVAGALEGAGVKFVAINVCKGADVPEQVASVLTEAGRFSSCIVLGWGSGGSRLENAFASSRAFRDGAVSWVNKGGRFIVQGERVQHYGNWPGWFGFEWEQSDYYRTDYTCHGKSEGDAHWCKWYHKAKGSITTSRYNAKAVLLSGVSPEDNLFSTSEDSVSYSLVPSMAGVDIEEGESAIALGRCGDGSVSFFGDVNAEEETCAIMAIIARGS